MIRVKTMPLGDVRDLHARAPHVRLSSAERAQQGQARAGVPFPDLGQGDFIGPDRRLS